MGIVRMLYSNCRIDFVFGMGDTKPKNSKAAGIGALVSVCVSVLWYVLMVVVGVGAGVAFGV